MNYSRWQGFNHLSTIRVFSRGALVLLSSIPLFAHNPPPLTAPHPVGVCPKREELPLPNPVLLRYAHNIAKSAHSVSGTAAIYGNVLAYAARSGQADEVVAALLEAFDSIGGENGQLTALLAETSLLTKNEKTIALVKDKLQAVTELLDPVANPDQLRKRLSRAASALAPKYGVKIAKGTAWAEGMVNHAKGIRAAYERYEEHPGTAAIEGAFIGLKTLRKNNPKLFSQADRLRLALLKVPAASELLDITLSDATKEEKRAAIRTFVDGIKDTALDTMKLASLRALAKHLEPDDAAKLVDSIQATFEAQRKIEKPEDFEFAASQFIRDLSARKEMWEIAEKMAARAERHLPRGLKSARNFVTTATSAIERVQAKEGADGIIAYRRLRDLEKTEIAEINRILIKELGPVALRLAVDIAGIVDPSPVCDAIGICLALKDRDYLSAALSAISLLPYVGDGIVKPIKIGRQLKPMFMLARKAQKAFARYARIKQKVDEAAQIAGIALETARGLERGDPLINDKTIELAISLAAGRTKLARSENLLQMALRDSEKPRKTPVLDFADALLNDPNKIVDGACNESRMQYTLRVLRRTLEEPLAPMKEFTARIRKSLPSITLRSGPVVRGQVPDEPDLSSQVATRLNLDGKARQRLQVAVGGRLDVTPEEAFAAGLLAKYPEE